MKRRKPAWGCGGGFDEQERIAYPIVFCFIILEKLVGLLDKIPDKDEKKMKMINPKAGHGPAGLWIMIPAIVGLILGWPVLVPELWLRDFLQIKLTDEQMFVEICIFGTLGFIVQCWLGYKIFIFLKAWWLSL